MTCQNLELFSDPLPSLEESWLKLCTLHLVQKPGSILHCRQLKEQIICGNVGILTFWSLGQSRFAITGSQQAACASHLRLEGHGRAFGQGHVGTLRLCRFEIQKSNVPKLIVKVCESTGPRSEQRNSVCLWAHSESN